MDPRKRCHERYFIMLLLIFVLRAPGLCQSNDELFGNYDIHHYFFDLNVSPVAPDISGTVEMHCLITEANLDTLIVELTDVAIIDSVLWNEQKAGSLHYDDLVFIPVPYPVSPGEKIVLKFFYSVSNADFPANEGITHSLDPLMFPVTWTLSEPFYSKNWFPCKQVLSDKIDSARLHFTCPVNCRVGSNGVLEQIVETDPDHLRYEWRTSYPMAYYLISFAVSDYMDYSFYAKINDADSVLVQNYIYNDSAYFMEKKEEIDAVGDMISLFSELFGPYPFLDEKYGHCLAPILGGMEHQTMTTLSDFRYNLVSHELAHQWFGDYVTCSNWRDIWINEGFASYSELLAIESLKSETEYYAWLSDAFELITSEFAGSVYVPSADSTNDPRIFDHRLTYEKGAYLIHMLRHEVNDDDLFFLVLRSFLENYSDSVATAEDFRSVLEELTFMDFSAFFEQWYYGEGFPTIDIEWRQNRDSLILEVVQKVNVPEITSFFSLPIDLKISYYGGDTLVRIRPASNSELIYIPIAHRVFKLTPDPDKWLLAEFQSITRINPGDSTKYFDVFPNPVQNEIIIENFEIGLPFNAKLYNSGGLLIDELNSTEAFSTFDSSTLIRGIYQVIITRDHIREVFPIAKF